MKTLQINIYEFNELSDKAKKKARDWYREDALVHEWWDATYEDAANVGLRLNLFSVDPNRYATGEFVTNAIDCASAIIREHGKDCDTRKTVQAFLDDTLTIADRSVFNDRCDAFLKAILNDYSLILQREYDYLLADNQVDESILANGYTFKEDGERFG